MLPPQSASLTHGFEATDVDANEIVEPEQQHRTTSPREQTPLRGSSRLVPAARLQVREVVQTQTPNSDLHRSRDDAAHNCADGDFQHRELHLVQGFRPGAVHSRVHRMMTLKGATT
jgi:hypothetical protein